MMMQHRSLQARRVAGSRMPRVAVSRRALRVQAVKKSVGDLKEADLKGERRAGGQCRRGAPAPCVSMQCTGTCCNALQAAVMQDAPDCLPMGGPGARQ